VHWKVFGRKSGSNASPVAAGNGKNYLSSHFSDVRQAARAKAATTSAADTSVAHKTFQKQKELEKLLMKAENEDISMLLRL